MRKLIPYISVLSVLSMPVYAWDNSNNSTNTSQATAKANSHASATSKSTARGGSARATGGTSNVSVHAGGGGGGGGGVGYLGVPSPSASGLDCPVIGPGIGGQSGLAAGIFSWGYISPDCNKRRTVAVLEELYGADVARAYAEKNIDGVAEAVAASRPGARSEAVYVIPHYCYTASAAEVATHHKECYGVHN